MVKATKAKISDKSLDVLQKTKKQSAGAAVISVKNVIDEPRRSRSRSRSVTRTPARPPPKEIKPAAKKKSQTPEASSAPKKTATPRGRPRNATKKETKPKKEPAAKKEKKAAPKKSEPKRVGKEPAKTRPKRKRSPPPRPTPTRQSKRISSVYNSIPTNSVDTKDSPSKSKFNHIDNNADAQSITSTSSRRGWFSNCVIV